MFGNWTLTAKHAGSPVSKAEGVRTAWWTCPIEAAARGVGLKSTKEERRDDPREDVKLSVSRLMDI